MLDVVLSLAPAGLPAFRSVSSFPPPGPTVPKQMSIVCRHSNKSKMEKTMIMLSWVGHGGFGGNPRERRIVMEHHESPLLRVSPAPVQPPFPLPRARRSARIGSLRTSRRQRHGSSFLLVRAPRPDASISAEASSIHPGRPDRCVDLQMPPGVRCPAPGALNAELNAAFFVRMQVPTRP